MHKIYTIYVKFKVYIRQSNTCISCEHILYFFPNRLSWLGQEEVTFSTNYNDHKRSSSSGSVKTNIYMLQENKLLGYPLLIPHALLNYCQLLKPPALLLIRVNVQTPSNEHLVISDIYKVIDVDVSHRTMTFILKIFTYPSLCLCLVFWYWTVQTLLQVVENSSMWASFNFCALQFTYYLRKNSYSLSSNKWKSF